MNKQGLLEWINEELSYEKIDPEPEGWILALKEIKKRFYTEHPINSIYKKVYLKDWIEEELTEYENLNDGNPFSEYDRGRISVLKEIWKEYLEERIGSKEEGICDRALLKKYGLGGKRRYSSLYVFNYYEEEDVIRALRMASGLENDKPVKEQK